MHLVKDSVVTIVVNFLFTFIACLKEENTFFLSVWYFLFGGASIYVYFIMDKKSRF